MAAIGLLLDTHTLLWWLFDDARLSPDAREAIMDPDRVVLVSSASAWEIATKHRLGRLPEAGDVPTRLPYYLRTAGFDTIAVSVDHALAAGSLPGPHRDPFDRMLIAQAQLDQLAIVTTDAVFRQYEVDLVW